MNVVVSALIKDKDGRILVEDHVKKDGFVFPGGKVQPGESPEEALLRELEEELGIHSIFISKECEFEGHGTYPADSDNMISWKNILYLIISYKGEITNKEPDKCRSLQWFYESDLVAHPNVKERYYFNGPGKAYRDKILNQE